MKMKKYLLASSLAFLFAGTMMASEAFAVAELRLSDDGGATWTTITDNGIGDDSGLVGLVDFDGLVGNFTVSLAVGSSKPTLGSADAPHMDLFNLQISSTGGGTLDMQFSDNGFTGFAPSPGFTFDAGGTTNGTVQTRAYAGASNNNFDLSSLISDSGIMGPGAVVHSGAGGANVPTPYSLTIWTTVTHTAGGQITSLDSELTAVPEPGTVLLFGSGLAALGLWRIRKTA